VEQAQTSIAVAVEAAKSLKHVSRALRGVLCHQFKQISPVLQAGQQAATAPTAKVEESKTAQGTEKKPDAGASQEKPADA
jgi:hypothetical protein